MADTARVFLGRGCLGGQGGKVVNGQHEVERHKACFRLTASPQLFRTWEAG